MAVKLGRILFKKVGGVVIPIRDTAKGIGTKQVRILPPHPGFGKVGESFTVKQGLKDADFMLQRKGSFTTVGSLRGKGFLRDNPPNLKEDIGLKLTNQDHSKDFMKFAFDYLHGSGYWKNKARGTLNLVGIRVADVKAVPMETLAPVLKQQREAYEASAYATQLAISKKAHKRLVKEIKKGGKLVEQGARKGEMRLVSGIDRKVNARAKGITFRRINGRIRPIRTK